MIIVASPMNTAESLERETGSDGFSLQLTHQKSVQSVQHSKPGV